MEILTATLCDFAAEYAGKLCIQGAFDTIFARQFPSMHPQCSIALRMLIRTEDLGEHRLEIDFVDPDGKPFIPPERAPGIPFRVDALPAQSYFLTRNLVFNFQGFPVPAPGQYEIRFKIDGVTEVILPIQFLEAADPAANRPN